MSRSQRTYFSYCATLSLHTRSMLGMMALRISERCEESTTMLSRKGYLSDRRLCLMSSDFFSGQGTAYPIRNLPTIVVLYF